MKIWTLAEYLRQLREGQIKPNRPFHTQGDELIEMGPLAKKITIPPMKINFPIQLKYIETTYRLLKPVLAELVNHEEFSWNYHYGFFSAKDVALGYLCETVNRAIFKTSSMISQDVKLQKFLFHTCETLSSGMDINKAVNHINNAYLHNQFKLMVSSLNLQRSTKRELIAFYKQENCYNMAYQVSLFSKKEFEQALVEQLQVTYNQIVKVIQNCNIKEVQGRFFVTDEDNYIELLRLFTLLFAELSDSEFPSLTKQVMQTIKQYSPFLRHSIESKEDSILDMQNLKMLIESLILKEPNKGYPVGMRFMPVNNVSNNSL